MFGYVLPDISGLTRRDVDKYQSFYCGLCHSLKRYGNIKRLALTYDMTFLAMFLSSMYDTDEKTFEKACIRHPLEKKPYISNKFVDYARDMTVALVYHKCTDDWADDRKPTSLALSKILISAYRAVKDKWPKQCGEIEKELSAISAAEKARDGDPDACANAFGRLMISIFCLEKDAFTDYVAAMSYNLGKFIYMADAASDYEADMKSGNYNPIKYLAKDADIQQLLEIYMGNCCNAFEMLPLERDLYIMRNILYGGVWIAFNENNKKETDNDK